MMEFKAKSLYTDPAALVAALIVVAAAVYAPAAEWLKTNAELLVPMVAAILGHYGVRASGVAAAGKAAASGYLDLDPASSMDLAPGVPLEDEDIEQAMAGYEQIDVADE